MTHWNDAGLTHEGRQYRKSKRGYWYYLHQDLGWCPLASKKTAKMLDEMERQP